MELVKVVLRSMVLLLEVAVMEAVLRETRTETCSASLFSSSIRNCVLQVLALLEGKGIANA